MAENIGNLEATVDDSGEKVLLITEADLLRAGGLSPPTDPCTAEQHKKWGFQKMSFRDIWWKEILKTTHRLPVAEWGGKFLVLTPGENVPHAEADLYKKLHTALKGYWYVQKRTPNKALNVEEREAKANSKRRVGRLATGLREAIGDYNDVAGKPLDVESEDRFIRPQIPSVRPPKK